jgi:hypothetical protein
MTNTNIVYVNPQGLIKYTQAHSASMDPNSTVTGWDYDEDATYKFGRLTWQTDNGHGFIACPATDGTAGAYSIQALIGGALPARCEQVKLIVPKFVNITAATAWQYT